MQMLPIHFSRYRGSFPSRRNHMSFLLLLNMSSFLFVVFSFIRSSGLSPFSSSFSFRYVHFQEKKSRHSRHFCFPRLDGGSILLENFFLRSFVANRSEIEEWIKLPRETRLHTLVCFERFYWSSTSRDISFSTTILSADIVLDVHKKKQSVCFYCFLKYFVKFYMQII